MSAPRELTRSLPFEIRDGVDGGEGEGDGLTFEGLAAVFGEETVIDSWEGRFVETVRKGAFRKAIRERTPVMQFDHGRHPLIGSIPIGRIEDLRETDEGLTVRARLSDNWLIEPVRDAVRDKTVNGMSFRFEVVRDEWRDANGKLVKPDELARLLWDAGDRGPLRRTLVEVKLPELGPVVFPAYTGTSASVRARSLAAEIRTDDELRREVQAALARQAPQAPADDLDDPATRREVARALLFGDRTQQPDIQTPDAPPDGHSSASQDRSDDAPAESHPSPDTDAPPPDGHPSHPPTERTRRIRGYIRDITAQMDDVLEAIKE